MSVYLVGCGEFSRAGRRPVLVPGLQNTHSLCADVSISKRCEVYHLTPPRLGRCLLSLMFLFTASVSMESACSH